MKLLNKLMCKHHHTIEDHPACFIAGQINEKQANTIFEITNEPWYKVDGLKIGYLDIESDGLKADVSTMLSWCIKEKEGEVAYDSITKEELFNGTTDQRIIRSLIKEMSKYKILCSFYGTRFDLPYIRSKALHYGYSFPEYGKIYNFDLFYTARNKLLLSRRSLEVTCEYLEIEGKTPLKRSTWQKAKYGDKEAIEEVVKHNYYDVIILEQLHDKLEPFAKWTRKSV